MHFIWYCLARALAAFLQASPMCFVALLGRLGGAVAFRVDVRHRRVALENLARAFGREAPPFRIHAMAREHFRRLGENYACAVKAPAMSAAELAEHFQVVGVRKLSSRDDFEPQRSRIVAIGHFGNFEMYSFVARHLPGFRGATTYRALPQPRLNRLVLGLRRGSGILLFDRKREFPALRRALRTQNLVLGLLADQHAGSKGLRLPFFGHDCSTTAAPALLALRYNLPLHTAICFRTGLAHWRVEIGDEIPTRENGAPRPAAEIMREVNEAFEVAVRRDPVNWFWVHRRWKKPGSQARRLHEPAIGKSCPDFGADPAAAQTKPV